MLNRILIAPAFRVCIIAHLIFLFIFLVNPPAMAQEGSPYPQVTIASPNAASLGKYTDVPVNNHTGIPQVNVPLYTVKEGPLTLPISLSYHAGGIKVMEPASWIGAGWSLQAGGMISRVVRGAPDEGGTTAMGIYGHFSHYGFSNYLATGSSTAPNDQAFANGSYDGEPDLFSFNFNGYSGRFYFDDDRKPVLVNGEDLKINYYFPRDTAGSYNAYTANIQGFIITVPSGDQYHFGITPGGSSGGAPAVELSFVYSGNPNRTDRLFATWFLTKIVSADGMFSISIHYQPENYSYYALSMSPVNGNFVSSWTNPEQNEYRLAKNYLEGVRLSQVTFSNGTVDFIPGPLRTDVGNSFYTGVTYTDNANTEAKLLEAISITGNQGFCKKYRLYHSYFTAPAENLPGYLSNYTIQTDRYRLKLDSLQEITCNNSLSLAPYRFMYYSNTLPRRLSFGQDHWGFYNGVTSNNTLIPAYTINTFNKVNGADRDPRWPAMLNGALTKVIYPTGGYTAYEFEPNRTWISTTRYMETYRYGYSVGYDGSLTATYGNMALSGNYYRVVMVNGPCPPNISNCAAGMTILNSSNVAVASMGIPGNARDTQFIQLPAGTYSVKLSRQATQTGQGAEVFFTEIIPNAPVQENAMAGGLRVKSIIQKDSLVSQDSIKTVYDYNFNGQSTGILYSRPAYVQLVRNEVVKMFGVAPSGNHTSSHLYPNGCMGPETGSNPQPYFKSACPIFPMASTQGNHIGYNEVKVEQPGNGYSIYRYYGSNLWDNNHDDIAYRNINLTVCSPSIPNSPAIPQPFEYRRGQLKYEGHFTAGGQLLKESHYMMEYDSTPVTPAYMVSYVLGAVLGARYELRGYHKKQTQVITYTYAPATGTASQVTQAVYHESPWHHQPTRQVTIHAAGDTQATRIKYAADFRISVCDTISTGLPAYTSACSSCDAAMYAATANCTTVSCRYQAWIDHIICRANARKAYIIKRRNNFTNPVNAFNTCLLNAKNAANTSLKPILELQQQAPLVPIEKTTWKNSGLLDASLNGYGYMAYPAGKVYLDKGWKINLAAPSNTFTQVATAANNTTLVTDSRYEEEGSFKHYAGNPVQITNRDGVSNAWLWDYGNTWPVARVSNAAFDRIAYTSFETNNQGGWSMNGGSVTGSSGGITGKKTLAGGVSKTVPSGNYVVSVWGTANTWVNGQLQTQPLKIIGNWKYYEVKLNDISTVTVTGDNMDEVRLYPQGAQMITYTYDPLVGITSQCDDNGSIIYYEYDGLGKLVQVRDEHRNILKRIEYRYQQAVQP